MLKSHIVFTKHARGCDVTVDDAELFDFIDDYLLEHGAAYEYLRNETKDEHQSYVMHFPVDVNPETIELLLASLPAEEIERIWALNNEKPEEQ
jgi:hypothetical protein